MKKQKVYKDKQENRLVYIAIHINLILHGGDIFAKVTF